MPPSGDKHHSTRLSNATVRAIRTHRRDTGDDDATIAKLFGCHAKTAYRIITGRARREAGGPIESTTRDGGSPLIRCPGCRALLAGTDCILCGLRWAWLVQVLREVCDDLGVPISADGSLSRVRLREIRGV